MSLSLRRAGIRIPMAGRSGRQLVAAYCQWQCSCLPLAMIPLAVLHSASTRPTRVVLSGWLTGRGSRSASSNMQETSGLAQSPDCGIDKPICSTRRSPSLDCPAPSDDVPILPETTQRKAGILGLSAIGRACMRPAVLCGPRWRPPSESGGKTARIQR